MKKIVVSLSFSILAAVLLSVILSLIFSFVAVVFTLPNGVYVPINLIIKLISVALGCFMFVKDEKGVLYGLLLGTTYFFVSSIVFNVISGDWQINLYTLVNLVYCTFVGMTVGVIKTNISAK